MSAITERRLNVPRNMAILACRYRHFAQIVAIASVQEKKLANYACYARFFIAAIFGLALANCMPTRAAHQYPLGVQTFQSVVYTQQNRRVALMTIAPAKAGTYPLIVFSHGALAAPSRYQAMLDRYANVGYVVIAPLHRDSELFDGPASDQATIWRTRFEDFAVAHELPEVIQSRLSEQGVSVDRSNTVAMGHSYGALIAQVAAGAQPVNQVESDLLLPRVKAVIAWSPPGPLPGIIAPEGWSSLSIPSFTQTGTADVLPGFIDDWTVHRTAYEMASGTEHWLWVGDGVDHYFGGIYGRESTTSSENWLLFGQAFETSLAFLNTALKLPRSRKIPTPTNGEVLERK
ncbi:MAG: hypothetical protein ABJ239_07730 [Erythrobacter sp.]